MLSHYLSQIASITVDLDWAENEERAQTLLKAQNYDLCLLGGQSGLTERFNFLIWAGGEGINLPFILLTNEPNSMLDLEVLEAGAEDFLYKAELTPALLQRSIRYAIEQYHAKRRIRESEARFRALIEHGADAIVLLTPEGAILYASPATYHLLGYGRGAATDAFEHLHPDDVPYLRNLLTDLTPHPGRAVSSQFRLRHRDGFWRWMEGRATNLLHEPYVEALVLNYRDISDRKEVEEQLDRVLTNARCILWGAEVREQVGVDGGKWFEWRHLYIEGESAQKVLPLELQEGQSYADAWFQSRHPDDIGPMDDRCHEAFVSGQTHYDQEFRCRDRSGEWRWLMEHVALQPLEEGRWHAVGVCTDITERRHLEEELVARNRELKEVDRRKDEFLSMLAHELRNPLAPLLNVTYLLKQRSESDPSLQRIQEMVERQVRQLSTMVDDLLDLARIRQGKVRLHKTEIDVLPVIEAALEAVRPSVEARSQSLTLSLTEGPLRVYGDEVRLQQVLVNLLHNAAKYTPDGGGITLRVEETPKERIIQIQDTGRGIAPEMLPHVFDLFAQEERSLSRSQGGLGVGLALVKSLTELHGGRVIASSDGVDKGSTFTILLPAPP